ncbi:MAG: hypothetical protein WCP79_06860 [Bacillota bacterium]
MQIENDVIQQKIILGSRQSGKTTELIKACANQGGCIVCLNQIAGREIERRAREMNIEIPLIITHDDFIHRHYQYPRGIKQFWIDDANELIRRLSALPIAGMAFDTTDYPALILRDYDKR